MFYFAVGRIKELFASPGGSWPLTLLFRLKRTDEAVDENERDFTGGKGGGWVSMATINLSLGTYLPGNKRLVWTYLFSFEPLLPGTHSAPGSRRGRDGNKAAKKFGRARSDPPARGAAQRSAAQRREIPGAGAARGARIPMQRPKLTSPGCN